MKTVFVDAQIVGETNYIFAKMQERFELAGHQFIKETCKNKEEIMEKTKDADAIITAYAPIDRDIMKNCPKLKAIVRVAIGYEILDVAAATELKIPVCNIPDYCAEEVAVHTIALILAAEKKLGITNQLVRRGDWKNIYGYPVHRLSLQTLGFIGFGRIARQAARYAQAFGMKVVAYDPYLPQEVFDELQAKKVDLNELFAVADVVSLNAPATKENYHIINKDSIAKMKDGVIIVNTGRGTLLSTADLIEGVKSGKVKAASLDVLEEEPLRDPNAEILKYDNIFITTHVAHDSVESFEDVFFKAVDTVVKIQKGELPDNVLNRKELQP